MAPQQQPDAASQDRQVNNPSRWVDDHADALFRYALLRLRDRASAEDAVQETFLAAVKAQADFKGQSQVRTWLVGILRHKLADHYRKNSREVQSAEHDDGDSVVDGWFTGSGRWKQPPKSWGVNPAELAERSEFWRVLERCLQALPTRAGEAFAMRVLNDMDSDEVCKALEISSTNLWVLLHRARARLRGCLETNWFGRGPEESA